MIKTYYQIKKLRVMKKNEKKASLKALDSEIIKVKQLPKVKGGKTNIIIDDICV